MNDFLNGQVKNDGFCAWRQRRRGFAWPMLKAMPRLHWRLFVRLPSAVFGRWCCLNLTCAATGDNA